MINRNCLVNDPYYCHPSRPTNHCWWTTTLSSKKLSKNAWLIIFQHFSIQIKEWLQVQNASFKTSFNIGVGVGEWGRAISEWENYNSRTQSDLIIPVPSRFLFSWELRCDLGPRATSSDNWDNWLISKMDRGLSRTNTLGIILDCVFSMDCFIQVHHAFWVTFSFFATTQCHIFVLMKKE